MKKFIIKTALLFLILVIGDILIGMGMKYVYENVKSGGQRRNNYIANELVSDIVVFGSSRALHHYNTRLIQDSLSMSCYNCGQDGNGILLDYGRLLLINRRHVPKYVVVDITPKYDLLSTKDGYDMGWLRPYYDDVKGIRDLFADVDGKERYKMLSSSYRYNSFFFMRIISWLSGKTEIDADNGFVAKKARFNRMKTTNMKEYPLEYDSLKLKYLSKFIDQASASSLVFVVSPVWYDQKTRTAEEIKPLRALCEKKGIPLFDFTNHPKYMGNDTLFCDGTHLNHLGADEFSREIVRILREKNHDVE